MLATPTLRGRAWRGEHRARAFANSQGMTIGDGNFAPVKQVNCSGTNTRQLWIGDLNGDCVGDVVTVTTNAGACVMMSTQP